MSSVGHPYTSLEELEYQAISKGEKNIFMILDIFNDISTIINKGQEFKQTLSELLDKVLVLTDMEKGGIYLREKETGDYHITVHSNVSEDFLKLHGTITSDWKSLQPIIKAKVVTVSDTLDIIPGANPKRQQSVIDEGFRSYVGIPLIHENSVDGILMASSSKTHKFSEYQTKLFSIIGKQIGISIKNSSLMEQLKKSREMYFDLFNNAKDIIYTHDIEGNFLDVNKAGLDTLQYSKKELLQSNIRDILSDESLEVVSSLMPCIITGKNFPFPFIFEVIKKDGKKLYMEFNIRPIIENGIPKGIHGIARDVDKRLIAEKNMLIFSKSVSLASDGINISDANHRITFINEIGASIFGYNRTDLIGQPVDIFYAEEDLPNLMENVIPSMEKYGYWNGLILGRKKDGKAFPVQVNLSSVMDKYGKPMLNIGVFREKRHIWSQ